MKPVTDDDAALMKFVSRYDQELLILPIDLSLRKTIHSAVATAIALGEWRFAAILLIVTFVRIRAWNEEATSALLEAVGIAAAELGVALRTCQVCGCNDTDRCLGGCEWAGWDLCSKCKARKQ